MDLSNEELIVELRKTWDDERKRSAWLIACLAEADQRGFLLNLGFSSTFAFCVKELRMVESEAVRRIKVARKIREFPELLALIDDGGLSIRAAALIAPLLKGSGAPALISRCARKPYAEIEKIVAAIDPAKAVPDRVRPLGSPLATPKSAQPADAGLFDGVAAAPSETASAGSEPADDSRLPAEPAPALTHFSFAASEEFAGHVERLKSLLWHKYPEGRLGDIFLEAARDYLERRDPAERLATQGPRSPKKPSNPRARRIPGWVKDRVRLRDQNRCAFVAADGRRCEETRGLEFDHVAPWALGGASNDPDNVRLLCAAHNRHEARRLFGGFPDGQPGLFPS